MIECDWCGKQIEDVEDGNVYYIWPETAILYFNHKTCALNGHDEALEAMTCAREGLNALLSEHLEVFLAQLMHNLGRPAAAPKIDTCRLYETRFSLARQIKRQRRTKAEVAAVREAAREELAEGHRMTLRQVHYRLVSRDDIHHPNTVSAYDTLGGWLRDDRLDGVIPWEWMEDRLRVAQGWAMWTDPARFLHSVRNRYSRNPWPDQSHYVEVWCEKDALSGIFSSALEPYCVTLNVGRGYDGWSSIKQAADRYRWRKRHGIDTTVLYFGDFDPSGEDMHRSLQERFNRLGVYPALPKVALTHEDAQVLPGDVTKAGNSRADAFVVKYGDLAVELDALPVSELRERIRSEVEALIDMDALNESNRIEEEERLDLRERIDRMYANEEES